MIALIRKVRVDTVTGEPYPGPWHEDMAATRASDLTRCGRRLKGFGVRRGEGEPTCTECLRLAEQGKTKSWRSR